jgi:hypothetical protein
MGWDSYWHRIKFKEVQTQSTMDFTLLHELPEDMVKVQPG